MKFINYLVLSKFAKGTDNHVDSDNLVAAINAHDGSEAYYNHFDVRQDALGSDEGAPSFKGAGGVCRPAFGLVGFDFDDEESPENSLRDVQAFLGYFRFDHFYVAYSGSKGFHISVPFEYFGLAADENLPKTLRNLAHELKPHFPTLDTSVYNIGRKFRAPNTRHGKTGLYKTILKSTEVDTTSMDAIKEYCKTRRELMYEPQNYEVEPSQILVSLLEKAQATALYDESKVGTALEPTRLESFDGKVCIKRLFESKIDEGERNTTALILINDLFKSGKAREHCVNVMTPWISRVMPEHRRAEVFQIIEDIYNGKRFYNHGCLEPIKSKHCSAKCGLWAKLNPDKRPVPIDAPKQAFKEMVTQKKLPAPIFIKSWFAEHNVNRTLAGVWYADNKSTMVKTIISKMLLDYREFHSATYQVVSRELILAYIDRYVEQSQEDLLRDLKDRISYRGDNNLVEKFLTAVVGEVDPIDLVVLKHCLWQVKRKMWGHRVTWHMMTVISGLTGSGKSVALKLLMTPLEDVTDYAQLSILNDERENFRFYENFVMIFDEMVQAGKTDINALKNRMTSDYAPQRALHTQIRDKWVNNCTFFGTTNNEVKDIIKDPTSARRYYQLTVKDKCDWDALNAMNFVELWQGIDENNETPYIEGHYDVLRERQEIIRHKDLVEDWLEYEDLYVKDGDGVKVRANDAYLFYMRFRAEQKILSPYTRTKFGRTLKNYVEKRRDSVGNYYLLSRDLKLNNDFYSDDTSLTF